MIQERTWHDYTRQLCDEEEGHQGVLCGVCVKGFGMTGPFKCRKCLGARSANYSNTAKPITRKPPSLGGISGLYVFYWAFLTGWYVFTVWTCMPKSNTADKGSKEVDVTDSDTAGNPVQGCPVCRCKECGCAGCAEQTTKWGTKQAYLTLSRCVLVDMLQALMAACKQVAANLATVSKVMCWPAAVLSILSLHALTPLH